MPPGVSQWIWAADYHGFGIRYIILCHALWHTLWKGMCVITCQLYLLPLNTASLFRGSHNITEAQRVWMTHWRYRMHCCNPGELYDSYITAFQVSVLVLFYFWVVACMNLSSLRFMLSASANNRWFGQNNSILHWVTITAVWKTGSIILVPGRTKS